MSTDNSPVGKPDSPSGSTESPSGSTNIEPHELTIDDLPGILDESSSTPLAASADTSFAPITVLVSIEDIEVPDGRFRKEFIQSKLDELKSSILETGLIHPLAAEPRADSDTWILRAGERRLRVIRSIAAEGRTFRCGDAEVPRGLVPIIEWNKLTERQRLELEVAENLDRTDFTWQERAAATDARHKLRTLQQGKPPTAQAIASEIEGKQAKGDQITRVSKDLILAKHLTNPDVAKAKTEKEALRIIEKSAQAVHQARLAKQFDLTKTQHRLIKGDCLEILRTMPEASFDVVLTDPPYGIDADDFGSQAAERHEYKDSRKRWEELMQVLPDELYRTTKPRAHAYLFCDNRLFERLGTLMVLANWTVFPLPIIWFKGNGMVPFPKHGPRRTYECILYAWKGERETLVLKNDCITRIPAVRNPKFAAQKPVALFCDLLSRSANPGDSILDCFGGSGPILVAANRMRLTATYIELDEDKFNFATTRSTTKDIDDGAEEDDGISIDLEA